MADTKISALTGIASGILADGDKVAVADASDLTVSYSATLKNIQTYVFAAGSATAGSWPILGSGTLLTAAVKGALEHDTDCLYFTTDAGNRGYVPVRHFTRCDSAFALQNVSTEQAMFPGAQDTLTLEAGTYYFSGLICVSGMSATSGNLAIDILGAGTATIGTWMWAGWGRDNAVGTGAVGGTQVITQQSGASIVTAGTATEMWVVVEGSFEVTSGGTIIPSLTLVTASAASMRAGSYIMFERIGSTTATALGQWA